MDSRMQMPELQNEHACQNMVELFVSDLTSDALGPRMNFIRVCMRIP